jgi:hypothetical protein
VSFRVKYAADVDAKTLEMANHMWQWIERCMTRSLNAIIEQVADTTGKGGQL